MFVEKMKKGNDDFINSNMPLLVIDGADKDKDEFARNIKHEKVVYLASLLNFEKIKIIIQKLVPPIINLDFLNVVAEISMPNPEVFVGNLVSHFKEIVPKKITEIDKLFQSHNLDDISKMAHYLQSVCYNVGANYFAEIFKELETGSKNGLVKKSAEYWRARLENEFQKTVSSLDKILKNKSYLKK
jgi:hypothetical protein